MAEFEDATAANVVEVVREEARHPGDNVRNDFREEMKQYTNSVRDIVRKEVRHHTNDIRDVVREEVASGVSHYQQRSSEIMWVVVITLVVGLFVSYGVHAIYEQQLKMMDEIRVHKNEIRELLKKYEEPQEKLNDGQCSSLKDEISMLKQDKHSVQSELQHFTEFLQFLEETFCKRTEDSIPLSSGTGLGSQDRGGEEEKTV